MFSTASVNACSSGSMEQVKLEAGMERTKVSQVSAELQQYCMQNACKNILLVGAPARSSPFQKPDPVLYFFLIFYLFDRDHK
uniref:Guanine nucleotide-binding protein subunit gamma n=1 Tax=Neovison vison TaxID=452646 RepID=A0A8C7AUA2_NEOVI